MGSDMPAIVNAEGDSTGLIYTQVLQSHFKDSREEGFFFFFFPSIIFVPTLRTNKIFFVETDLPLWPSKVWSPSVGRALTAGP